MSKFSTTPSPADTPATADAFKSATETYGPLWFAKKICPLATAQFLALAYADRLVYTDGTFYARDLARNLWSPPGDAVLRAELSDFLVRFGLLHGVPLDAMGLSSALSRILEHLQKFLAAPDFFARANGEIIIHCLNCFLKWEGEKFVEYPLTAPTIHSRNQLPVAYDPNAKAPRFMDELLKPVLDEQEITVFLQYIGQCLAGYNISETLLFVFGLAGGGKSTAVNIIEMIIGKDNVTELRTNHLDGWFENHRYIGKSLLTGKDVPPDCLKRHGASCIKALTGKDRLSTEAKHSNEVIDIVGAFNIIITSNCDQPILMAQDRDAWARRVRVIRFKNHKPDNPIRNFDEILFSEEGSGILNLALEGLAQVIRADGRIEATQAQAQAVENLLNESESIKFYLDARVEPVEPKDGQTTLRQVPDNLTSEELYLEYLAFCEEHRWTPERNRLFCSALGDLMPRLFKRFKANDILRPRTRRGDLQCGSIDDYSKHRGFYAVRFKNTTTK